VPGRRVSTTWKRKERTMTRSAAPLWLAASLALGASPAAAVAQEAVVVPTTLPRIAGPGDRILLVIGAGDAPILWHLVQSHPEMRLVEAVDFLD
jgi:hypothetical protein